MSGGPRMWASSYSSYASSDSVDEVKENLASLVRLTVEFAPLIRSGVLIARSQWPTLFTEEQALLSSVRHDVRNVDMQAVARAEFALPLPTWDTLRGMRATMTDGSVSADKPWETQYEFYYLAKTLAIAKSSGARYMPWAESDLALLKAKLGRLDPSVSMQTLEVVSRFLVPDLEMSAQTAVQIRQSDSDFEEWRATLRSLDQARIASGSVADLTTRIEDELLPVRNRVQRSVDRSAVMKKSLRTQGATIALSGAPGVAAAGLSGGNPLATGAAIITTGVLRWCWEAYKRPALEGSDAIIASLIRQ